MPRESAEAEAEGGVGRGGERSVAERKDRLPLSVRHHRGELSNRRSGVGRVDLTPDRRGGARRGTEQNAGRNSEDQSVLVAGRGGAAPIEVGMSRRAEAVGAVRLRTADGGRQTRSPLT